MKEVLFTDRAPLPIGPYSQGIRVGEFLFLSGQIPVNPATGEVVSGDVCDQTRQVIENIKSILVSAGTDLSAVVKTTVFLKDMNHFTQMNGVYEEMFQSPHPARSAIEVARLPKDVLVEIEVVAHVPA